MTGWSFTYNFQTVTRWQCVNNAVDNYLVMRYVQCGLILIFYVSNSVIFMKNAYNG